MGNTRREQSEQVYVYQAEVRSKMQQTAAWQSVLSVLPEHTMCVYTLKQPESCQTHQQLSYRQFNTYRSVMFGQSFQVREILRSLYDVLQQWKGLYSKPFSDVMSTCMPSNCMYQGHVLPPVLPILVIAMFSEEGSKSILHEHQTSVVANQPLDFLGF